MLPSTADLGEMEFLLQKESLVRQERSQVIRGHHAKVKAATLWADKQEVTVERRQKQLETEKVKLQIDEERHTQAQDSLKAEKAMTQLNQLYHVKRLAKKAYQISGDAGILKSAANLTGSVGSILSGFSAGNADAVPVSSTKSLGGS